MDFILGNLGSKGGGMVFWDEKISLGIWEKKVFKVCFFYKKNFFSREFFNGILSLFGALSSFGETKEKKEKMKNRKNNFWGGSFFKSSNTFYPCEKNAQPRSLWEFLGNFRRIFLSFFLNGGRGGGAPSGVNILGDNKHGFYFCGMLIEKFWPLRMGDLWVFKLLVFKWWKFYSRMPTNLRKMKTWEGPSRTNSHFWAHPKP